MISFVVAFIIMRTTLFITVALIAGFGLGWLARFATTTATALTQETKPTVSFASTPVRPTPPPAPAATADPGPVEVDRAATPDNRIETLRWLRQSGVPVNLRAFSGDKFTPALGKILGLTSDETNRLNGAALEAKHALDAVRLGRASSHPSEDGRTLVVESPAIDPATSRALYEGLLGTLKTTLGPERYGLFNELTGDSFEAGFDQFGLNSLRYEIVLQSKPPPAGNLPYLEYKRHYVDPTGASQGWSDSTVSIAHIEKNDPILAHFIPPKLKVTEAK